MSAGYVKHIASETVHRVDNPDAVIRAYPGQYEPAKAADAKGKEGWDANNKGDAKDDDKGDKSDK